MARPHLWALVGSLLPALLLGPALGGVARAHDARVAPPVLATPVVPQPLVLPYATSCSVDVRIFDTLRFGPVDYCRQNLRYRPGALECFQYTDQVCSVFVPGSGLTETRSPVHTQVFPCPDGPEPPVCRRFEVR